MNDIETIHINVTKDDLDNCDQFEEGIEDYPLYGYTSNLCRADIVLLSKLLEHEFGNEATLEVMIKVKNRG